MTMVAQGTLKPVIDCVLPLNQALEGLRLIQDREVIGKVVIKPEAGGSQHAGVL